MTVQFDSIGYIDAEKLTEDDTLHDVTISIKEKHTYLRVTLESYQKAVISLHAQLECLEHSERTIWLLFDEQGNLKKE